jgi:cytidine deaminase
MTNEELVARADAARRYAYAPYSHFTVGAALLCEDGTVYTGCNIEGASFGNTICAERTALCKAVSEGARRFRTLAVIGDSDGPCAPCGICRQMLWEFAPELTVLCADRTGRYEETTLRELLPRAFSGSDL